MLDPESSAQILLRLRDGDEQAAAAVFHRYLARLTLLARSRLSSSLAARTDPEDVVLSAYRSFFIGARQGKFALRRSEDLWSLLVTITLRKVYRQVRVHSAARRSIDSESEGDGVASEPPSREPSPEEAIALNDELQRLLLELEPLARRVLELRLQDEPISEIAAATSRSERTVRRTLAEIRGRLVAMLNPDSHD